MSLSNQKPVCYIVSCKYAPGLFKEFHLLGRNLLSQGYKVKYLLSEGYKWMLENVELDKTYISSSKDLAGIAIETFLYPFTTRQICARLFKKEKPAFICFYNPHPLNPAIAKLAKHLCPDGVRTVFLHEPGKADKSCYEKKGRLFFSIVESIQKLTIGSTTDIILPSPNAMQLFKRFFPNYRGRCHYAPILIPDNPGMRRGKRKYFSMVGRFNFSKKLDPFIQAADYAARKNMDLEFQIVTSSCIDQSLEFLTPQARSKMRIINKKNISDQDISNALGESFAVLCLHKMVTQSGVVPVAFMNSTPVIALAEPGFMQFITHEDNGWLLSSDFTVYELLKAMQSVRDNYLKLSENARLSYLKHFAEKNWEKYYSWLLDILHNETDIRSLMTEGKIDCT